MSKRLTNGLAIRAIRELREASEGAEFSQARFATRVFASSGQLCNIEKGRRSANPDLLAAIAAALGVPVEAISYVIPACQHEAVAA